MQACDNGSRQVTPAEAVERRKRVCHDIMPEGAPVPWAPRGPVCATCEEVVFADMCRCGDGLARFVILQTELLYSMNQALDNAAMDYLNAPSDESRAQLDRRLRNWLNTRRARGL
jgi:hypothetical protein